MRNHNELQRAHDILHAAVEKRFALPGALELGFTDRQLEVMHAVHDAISWCLNGPCGGAFADNLAEIERAAEAHGYRVMAYPPKEN